MAQAEMVKDYCQITVLYVDDDAGIRGMVGKLLCEKFENVRVVFAEDGIEGLVKIGEYHPDIIIADLYMPYLSGMHFIENVLRLNKESIVVVISACSKPEVVESCLSVGVRKFLTKPFDFMELIETVQKLMIDIFIKKIIESRGLRLESAVMAQNQL